MATQTQVQVIDADAHVVETERTWDYLDRIGIFILGCPNLFVGHG